MNTINKLPIFLLTVLVSAFWFTGCETDITVDLPAAESKIVVEAYIEDGVPPFVTLTRNTPFFGDIDLNNLDAFFVHDAEVIISNGSTSVELVEYCLDDLPPDLIPLASELFGIDLESGVEPEINFCVYSIDFLAGSLFFGESGTRYTMEVLWEEETLTASTNLLFPIPPDSLWWTPHPDPENDTLVSLNVRFTDPDTLGNYYRYFTQQNNQPLYPGLAAAFDDLFINGQTFDFSIDRGQPRSADFDIETYGYFGVGDTVILKWATIDRSNYDFWITYEADASSGGPFSSATILATNIKNGLGIFGAYGSSYDTLVVGL